MRRSTLAIVSLGAAAAAFLLMQLALRGRTGADGATSGAGPRVAQSEPAPEPVAAAPDPTGPDAAAEIDVVALAQRAEAREQALRDELLRIGNDDSVTLDARLERYARAVEAARAARADTPLVLTPSILAEIFLRMEGVQRELAALDPGRRAQEIANIRRELGFPEAEIERLEGIDERREARWQNGYAYMAERQRIAGSYSGDALDGELRALRQRYFGPEAPTIAAEEAEDFYRFERPRVYGRN